MRHLSSVAPTSGLCSTFQLLMGLNPLQKPDIMIYRVCQTQGKESQPPSLHDSFWIVSAFGRYHYCFILLGIRNTAFNKIYQDPILCPYSNFKRPLNKNFNEKLSTATSHQDFCPMWPCTKENDIEGLPHRCFQRQGALPQPQEPMPSSGLLPTFEE